MTPADNLIAKMLSWLEWDAVQRLHPTLQEILALVFLLLVGLASYWVARRLLTRLFGFIAHRTPFRWDDLLFEEKALHPLVHLVPVLVLYLGLNFLPTFGPLLSRLMEATLVAVITLVMLRGITVAQRIYDTTEVSQHRPITTYAQLAKLAVILIAVVMVISALLDKSPAIFLSGLGALTALILLIFRDTIMSFIASLQFTTNKMLQVGDWIESPAFGADGSVIEIALHTIKVRNWDNTIIMIPTYKLIESAFINWKGMHDSGGRRIKRALLIDQTSISFLDAELLEKLGRIRLLGGYLDRKQKEIEDHRRERGLELDNYLDGRHLTNLGTFRAYVEAYLRDNPKIHESHTFLVRHRAPTPQGLPLEIYVFTNDTNWFRYEGIQADIFDHLLAILPEFGLRVFQNPSSHDVVLLARVGKAFGAAGEFRTANDPDAVEHEFKASRAAPDGGRER